jgi:hypothetical protein
MFNRFIAAMRAVAGDAGHNMLYLSFGLAKICRLCGDKATVFEGEGSRAERSLTELNEIGD